MQIHRLRLDRMCVVDRRLQFVMTLLLLEALAAGLILIFIIWWTMFSGRHKGELPPEDPPALPQEQRSAAPAASEKTRHPPDSH